MPPMIEIQTGDSAHRNRRLRTLGHSVSQIANYQLTQKNAQNIEIQKEKEKNIDFERSLLDEL